MKLKRIILAVMLAVMLTVVLSSHADAPRRGKERLRELALYPAMNLSVQFQYNFNGLELWIADGLGLPDEIARQQEELRKQPDDIQGSLRLAFLLNKNDLTNDAEIYWRKSEQLCRTRLETQPKNGLLLSYLGEALGSLDKNDEAMVSYRQAVLVSSNEWKCWAALGLELETRSQNLLLPENASFQIGLPIPQAVLDFHPSLDALKASEEKDREASRCFERAVALGKKESEVFALHAEYTRISNWRNCLWRHIRDHAGLNNKSLGVAYLNKASAADLRKAAELKPKDYKYISMAAYFEWSGEFLNSASPTNFTPELLSDSARKFIHEAMSKLENLSSDPDKKIASGALENLGLLTVLFGGSQQKGADYFRRAVALGPDREQSWDGLFGFSVESSSLDELLVLCEARLKHSDSARNHLIMAKILSKQKKWDKATEQSQAALKLEPDNVSANIMLVALTIRQSGDDASLGPAKDRIKSMGELFVKLPENQEKMDRSREVYLNTAIICGLSDGDDRIYARKMIDSLLRANPNDDDAKNISQALE